MEICVKWWYVLEKHNAYLSFYIYIDIYIYIGLFKLFKRSCKFLKCSCKLYVSVNVKYNRHGCVKGEGCGRVIG